ncbi:MAG: bifunctional 5,10-methylenetetrahydrofolate dehydrogenase/5,10-methenyltetrahydrofolate cyclohydrolase [Lachnospiraceae bacterium]|nr:bifunctional 5,10-methylenetetrahydrofolate dehydrogenase/5,10-methenyltetrahydrofolate cyclohydrolase [Lachnospiraceae bacterium]
MELIKGADVRKELLNRIREESEALPCAPKLVMVRLGEDPSDLAYENNARKLAEKLGIRTETVTAPREITHEDFMELFRGVNEDPDTDGILLFRPLPKTIKEDDVMRVLDPVKDVDCISPKNLADLFAGKTVHGPCTAEAVMEMLHYAGINPEGKRATVIGRSMVVGKPLAMMLMKENATVTVCHRKTVDTPGVAREAELLFVCVGEPEMVDGTYVKDGAAVFDVGINVNESGEIVGDCLLASVSEKASLLTPVPGGVGAVTTAVLMHHVVLNARKRRGLDG